MLLQETKLEEKEMLKLARSFWRDSSRIAPSSHGVLEALGTLQLDFVFSMVNSIKSRVWITLLLEIRDTKE